MVGAHSDLKICNDECDWLEDFVQFKGIVEERAGKEYEVCDPIKYTQQVVAGNIFRIKYHVGDMKYVHV